MQLKEVEVLRKKIEDQKKELRKKLLPDSVQNLQRKRHISKKAKPRRKKEGKPASHNYGYKRNINGKYIPIPEEKQVIKEIFTTYQHEKSVRKTERVINAKGLVNRKGEKWQYRTIYNILRNPVYIGHYEWKGQIVKNTHEPLIEESLYTEVNNLLSKGR